MSDNVILFDPPRRPDGPPSRAEFFAHCRLLVETNGFDTSGLAALTADFGGTKLTDVPIGRWREMMTEGTRRSSTALNETPSLSKWTST